MKRVIYPGSFDPLTYGHLDIIKRSSQIFDEVIVGILNNSAKKSLFTIEERLDITRRLVAAYPNVKVDTFDGLLVDFAKRKEATIIVRGLRAVTDYDYEIQIAQTNKVQYPELETIFMTTSLNYSYLSSTIVREFASYGGDISNFVPEELIPLIQAKYINKGEV